MEDAQGFARAALRDPRVVQAHYRPRRRHHPAPRRRAGRAGSALSHVPSLPPRPRRAGAISSLIPRSAHGTNFATATMAGFAGSTGEDRLPRGRHCRACVLSDLERPDQGVWQPHRRGHDHEPQHLGHFRDRVQGDRRPDSRDRRTRLHGRGQHERDRRLGRPRCARGGRGGTTTSTRPGPSRTAGAVPETPSWPSASASSLTCPVCQIEKQGGLYRPYREGKSIGSFHRHWGNFAHKVRCYALPARLGREGVRRMSAVARPLSARYVQTQLTSDYALLPQGADEEPRMHEFILTPRSEDFGPARIGRPAQDGRRAPHRQALPRFSASTPPPWLGRSRSA